MSPRNSIKKNGLPVIHWQAIFNFQDFRLAIAPGSLYTTINLFYTFITIFINFSLTLMRLLPCFLFLSFVQICVAQSKTTYLIAFPNAVHHEAIITATFSEVGNQPLETIMSRSSPGRYAVHDFAKHVYNVKAVDGAGKELTITRSDPNGWVITGHNGTVKLTYTLFGDRADGTFTGINELHAHLNMPATFMWAKGLQDRPIEVVFQLPEGSGWKVATQLKPEPQPNTFSAPHLQYFMDCPTEISNWTIREWTVNDKGKAKTLRLVMHHNGTEGEVDAYAERCKKVVLEEMAVFGELPDYDFGTYTFMACYLPYAEGDGMEHRNSTILTAKESLKTDALDLLGTVSHEFFHSWNVERIRPKTLEPFDFERANMSEALWFAEGFTNYYGGLTLARTGDFTLDAFTRATGGVLDHVINAPGRLIKNAVEMSQYAPFADRAVSAEPNNQTNTYISYYFYGQVIALALDLTLRNQFKNLTLDTYMRRVWEKYGKTEKPYSLEDLQQTLGEITDNPAFANDFFNKYILGKELAPYETLLGPAGLVLRKANAGKASWGRFRSKFMEGGLLIDSNTSVGSPVYKAGVDRGDVILTLDGQKVRQQELASILSRHKPGDTIEIEFMRLGKVVQSTVTLEEDRSLELVTFETAGKPVTKAVKDFRKAWLKN
jgi:predicted metalloprotease with PDZ domain